MKIKELKKPVKYWFEECNCDEMSDSELQELDKYLVDLREKAEKKHFEVTDL